MDTELRCNRNILYSMRILVTEYYLENLTKSILRREWAVDEQTLCACIFTCTFIHAAKYVQLPLLCRICALKLNLYSSFDIKSGTFIRRYLESVNRPRVLRPTDIARTDYADMREMETINYTAIHQRTRISEINEIINENIL